MKIAVTVTDCIQIGCETWQDITKTKIFDSSESFDTILTWAKKIRSDHVVSSLKFSEVEE